MSNFHDLEKRPSDVFFVQFCCNMDGQTVDKRVIIVPDLSFSFCLKLPPHEYDTTSKTSSLISTPSVASCSGAASLARKLFAIGGTTTTPSSTSKAGGSSGKAPLTNIFSSPAMKNFMASKASSTNTKRGYYRACDFLDNQSAFVQAFGLAPTLVPENLNSSNYSSLQKIVRDYGESCKLDIFLHLCQLNYVGNDKVDVALNTQEVCSKISSLRQVFLLDGHRRTDMEEDHWLADDKKKAKSTYYMNVKFTVTASKSILLDIRDKYKSLLATLLEADDDLELLLADPDKPQPAITDPIKILQKMTRIGKYFQSTSRPPKEDEGDIWATFRIHTLEEMEDILQATEYDHILNILKLLQRY